jgi:hypothetical protein
MADASPTFRRALAQPAGLRLEKYLGIAGVTAAILGVLAMFGSVDSLWYYAKTVLGSLYVFAVAVAS